MIQLLLAIIYLAFISLGLPDSVLGAAWPTMYPQLGVPVSWAGIISMIIALGTVVSSLLSDRLTRRLGTGLLTAISVGTTALALFGFSVSNSFLLLCLLAVPYGLGAGSVDAALNNYVALHYASRHMSWLHCMWGVGATLGPYIMGAALTGGAGWSAGYRYISAMQVALTLVLLLSLPLWKRRSGEAGGDTGRALTMREIVSIPGAKAVMLSFYCYCALEQTAILWVGSYLTLYCGVAPEKAASLAGTFVIGITAGRALSGFLTFRLNDGQMVRLGQAVTALGIAALLLPLGTTAAAVGFVLMGLGCAPVYPSIIHSTPEHFGADKSQAVIGVQMASAYVGIVLMPPLFGLIAGRLGVWLLPFYLLAILAVMALSHERLLRATRGRKNNG